MERRRNEIWFSHPSRTARSIKFVPYGKKGLHAAGGVWGEADWFEFCDPDPKSAVSRIKASLAWYRKNGFVIAKSKIIDSKLANVLGLSHTPPTKSNEAVAKVEHSKATVRALALLARAQAKTFEAYRSAIKEAKYAYMMGNLDAATRARLREFLYRYNDELANWAAHDPKIARRARHVLPPAMLPKKPRQMRPSPRATKPRKSVPKHKASQR